MVNQEKEPRKNNEYLSFSPDWYVVLLLIFIIPVIIPVPVTAVPVPHQAGSVAMNLQSYSDLAIVVKNIDTGDIIPGARIYLDGGYEGITSIISGSLRLSEVTPGEHFIRVINRGYSENISAIHVQGEIKTVILLHPLKIIPIGDHGPVEERIDIVFVPSKTQYDCTKKETIDTDYYTSNEKNFRNDVDMIIQKNFLTLDKKISNYEGLPENFINRFNFYYYSDPGDFADAFRGCAGTLPDDFWEEAPFTDVAIIIYPKYGGTYTGPPCEPNGCSSGMGIGIKSWFKAPADSEGIFMHEAAHAIFDLIDTYCGETYYTQNDPYPNVWTTQSGCIQASENNQWDNSACRQIAQLAKQGNSISCQKNFWRYDPEPDIMSTTSDWARFGNASTLHIRYLLENINRWKS